MVSNFAAREKCHKCGEPKPDHLPPPPPLPKPEPGQIVKLVADKVTVNVPQEDLFLSEGAKLNLLKSGQVYWCHYDRRGMGHKTVVECRYGHVRDDKRAHWAGEIQRQLQRERPRDLMPVYLRATTESVRVNIPREDLILDDKTALYFDNHNFVVWCAEDRAGRECKECDFTHVAPHMRMYWDFLAQQAEQEHRAPRPPPLRPQGPGPASLPPPPAAPRPTFTKVPVAPGFAAGDLVDAAWGAEWLPATVVSMRGADVEISWDVDRTRSTVPPTQLRRRGGVVLVG